MQDVFACSLLYGKPVLALYPCPLQICINAGLLAYIAMAFGLATMANSYAEGARLGLVLYVVFDFTSTFMYHAWTIKVWNANSAYPLISLTECLAMSAGRSLQHPVNLRDCIWSP